MAGFGRVSVRFRPPCRAGFIPSLLCKTRVSGFRPTGLLGSCFQRQKKSQNSGDGLEGGFRLCRRETQSSCYTNIEIAVSCCFIKALRGYVPVPIDFVPIDLTLEFAEVILAPISPGNGD